MSERDDRAGERNAPLFAFYPAGILAAQADARSPLGDITFGELNFGIEAASGYLIKNCDADGYYHYRLNANPKVKVPPKYNVIRHAGAIYAMAMSHRHHPTEPKLEMMRRAADFLKERTVGPVEDNLAAVWSDPTIEIRKGPAKAKLGGTGLGLVALVGLEAAEPGNTPIDFLRRMGEFLLFMQKSDGGFYTDYKPGEGRSKDWISLYYPGEAALGLMMLHELQPSERWLQAAANALGYLCRLREGQQRVEADHWALLATGKLLKVPDLPASGPTRQALMRHSVQICRSILAEAPWFPVSSIGYGCLVVDGRTCPTSTRLEGLLAALNYLPAEETNLHAHIRTLAHRGIRFLLKSQIRSGSLLGGIPRSIGQFPKDHPRFSAQFNRRATEVRIDYVQHALSAMIQYAPLVRT